MFFFGAPLRLHLQLRTRHNSIAPPAGTSPYPKPDQPISVDVNDVKHAVSLLPPEKQSMAAEILKGGYKGGSHVTVSPD